MVEEKNRAVTQMMGNSGLDWLILVGVSEGYKTTMWATPTELLLVKDRPMEEVHL